jgi:uncharacterized membrane protein YhaH (DUF805 family)
MNWVVKCFQQYADFSGRARRTEYWMFWLFSLVAGFVCGLISEWLSIVLSLAIFIPSLAVGVRRLHDVGKSGWMLLIGLIPIIGTIWLLILLVSDSQPGVNKWGANPKGL